MSYFATGAALTAALNALPASLTGTYKAFDAFYYAAQYMGNYTGTLTPIEHFVQIGAARGYQPNADFNPAFYQSQYSDLAGLDAADLLFHYVKFGLNEGRAGNATLAAYNWADYLAAYPAVADYVNANLSDFAGSTTNGAIAHYVKFGAQQGFTLPNTVGQTFTLTTGVDTVAGTAGNDTIIASQVQNNAGTYVDSLTALDNIDGGAGNDTLNYPSTAAITILPTTTVTNVETVNFTSASTVSAAVAAWTGLTSVNSKSVAGATIVAPAAADVTATDALLAAGSVKVDGGRAVSVTTTSAVAGDVTVGAAAAPVGAITVSHTVAAAADQTGGAVKVTGGTTAAVTQAATSAVNTTTTFGAVTITGKAATTAVTSTQTNAVTKSATVAGVVNSTVDVIDASAALKTATAADKAGTISTVTLNGFAAASVASAALNTLNLGGTGTSVDTYEGGLTAKTNTTLNVNLNAATITGAITDKSNQFDTINLNLTGKSTLGAAIVDTALKTINISGAGSLGSSTTIADLTTASVTKIDASHSSGANTVKVDATKATYTGGSGNDFVQVTAAATKAIDGGAGSADVVNLKGAGATLLTAATGALLTNFEALDATGGAGTFDMSLISGVTSLKEGAITGATTFSNVAAGTTLTITAAPTAGTTYTLKDATGTADSLNVTLTSADTIDANTLTANGIENITINTLDTGAPVAPAIASTRNANKLTLVDDKASIITVTGTTALELVATGATIIGVDATGLNPITDTILTTAGQSLKWVSGPVTGSLIVKGSASGFDYIDTQAAATFGSTVSITVGAGVNTLKGSTTLANTINGGSGVDTITTGAGDDVINAGAGDDSITSGPGLDVLTGGAGNDTFVLAPNANGNTYATITDLTKGDTVDMSALKGAAAFPPGTGALGLKVTLADTANFADFLNAAAASAVPGPVVYLDAPADTVVGTAAGTSIPKWFQYSGNTYVVFDNNHATTFQNSATTGDQLVKLTGLIDLSAAALTSGVLVLTA